MLSAMKHVVLVALTLIFAAVGVGIAIPNIDSGFRSVELGIASVSPAGPSGGYVIPASCNARDCPYVHGSSRGRSSSSSSPPPVATVSDSPDPTIRNQAFTVSYGRSGGGPASSCTLQRRPPGGSYSTIRSNPGNQSNVSQTLSGPPGVWSYRASCTGPGGSSGWVSVNHTLNPPPPPGVGLSDSPDPTKVGRSFSVSYGRSGGGSASSCILQRAAPGGSFIKVHSNSGGTSNVSQTLYDPLGVWKYRASCTGPGGSSGWVSVNHTLNPAQCTNTPIDDDSDGRVDRDDPGCYTNGSYNPGDDDERDTLPISNDNFDNDGDGITDDELDVAIAADPVLIRRGGSSDINWTGTGRCAVTGPGLLRSFDTGAGDPGTDSFLVTDLQEESVYAITCSFIGTVPNTASARVIVLPSFQEF